MEELTLFKSNGEPGLDAVSPSEGSRASFVLLRLLSDALDRAATDIHVESEGPGVKVRYRVDGFLRPVADYDLELGRRLISCVKVICDMDITKKSRFQDGSFLGKRGDEEVDFRVSVIQEVGGDKMVVRILQRKMHEGVIESLGLNDDLIATMRGFTRRSQGTLIVAGPTGVGKTTTLYALLQEVDRTRRNVVSIEDPVEYHLPLMTQIHVNPKVGMSFAAALRSVLRQDPNILMIGEIRDAETAEIALQSALTGHLILTTTHAKDAIGAIFRLSELNIPPYQLVTTVNLILAQRLARKLCERCKKPLPVKKKYFATLGFPAPATDTVYRAGGCPECDDTGYRGRVGVFELLQMNDPLRDAILRKAPESELQALQASGPYPRLVHDAMKKVEQGVLSMEEVSRVLV
ncbi:MAG: type II/IV secretion system protein [Planctomycetes bacterium]|nr:type II/IV secretion system protein [Planctomycetota bacterium]